MTLARLETIMVLALLVAPAEGQTPAGEEFINRREEARDAFLATPAGIYLHYCAHCHGDNGTGGGRLWSTGLSPTPADLTATQLDQAALVEFITKGSAASGGESSFCPPWGRTISAPNVQRIARHIVSLSGSPPPRTQEEETQASELKTPSAGTPWKLLGVIVAEIGLLLWMVFRKRGPSHAVSKDPAVR